MTKDDLKAGMSKVIRTLRPIVSNQPMPPEPKAEKPSPKATREKARMKHRHRPMKNRKGETATLEIDEHLPNALKKYLKRHPAAGTEHTVRDGEPIADLDKDLAQKSADALRVELSSCDRSLFLSVLDSLHKSPPFEIAARLVSQQRAIDDLKANTDLLATRFVEERDRLDSVIRHLNARAERVKRLICLSAVLALVVVGTTIAWETGGISSGTAPQTTTSGVAH